MSRTIYLCALSAVAICLFCEESAAQAADQENQTEGQETNTEETPRQTSADLRFTEPLLLSQGTLQIGGTVMFGVTLPLNDESDSGFGYTVSPSVGIFVIDNLELSLYVGHYGAVVGGDYFGDNFHFGTSVRWVFDIDTIIYPYLGARFGMSFYSFGRDSLSTAISAGIPAGILVGLNRHVAIDIGLSFNYNQTVSGPFKKSPGELYIPAGYFGIEAFF